MHECIACSWERSSPSALLPSPHVPSSAHIAEGRGGELCRGELSRLGPGGEGGGSPLSLLTSRAPLLSSSFFLLPHRVVVSLLSHRGVLSVPPRGGGRRRETALVERRFKPLPKRNTPLHATARHCTPLHATARHTFTPCAVPS